MFLKIVDAAFMNGCVCPRDTVTYECIVVGRPREVTVWRGSAFNCLSSNNEIVLLHQPIISNEVYYYTCNNGAIAAWIISVDGNTYTSQLNVTVTPEIAGKTIECLHDDGSFVYTLFSLTISIIGLFPSIMYVHVASQLITKNDNTIT